MATAQPRSRSRPRGVSEMDEDAALAELEKALAVDDYHGFCALGDSLWGAIQQLRLGAHGQHADRARPADPSVLAGTTMRKGRPGGVPRRPARGAPAQRGRVPL